MIILRSLQLKGHIREEAEEISSLIGQEEAMVSTRGKTKEIDFFNWSTQDKELKIPEAISTHEGRVAEKINLENWLEEKNFETKYQ